ncbi:isocitrate lyase/PEP mutase family protein [Streptomyces sp. NPDC001982]|uniref:isocitrate lyase/PEP mutase family protein n=1 Tax=Streptomyces sp. NPDC001982 TaxID=3154405 RepID=UPI003326C6B4
MADAHQGRARLRQIIESGTAVVVPGAPNALTARLIEEVGFRVAYVTGAGIANTYLGVPDIGLLTLTEVASHVAAIDAAVSIPLIVDADTGFGNAVNTWYTVRTLERAGASALQLEDQTFPKRCGHFEGKSTISGDEMADKIRAAADARTDPDLLIIARTDARAEYGLAEAIRRVLLYREAGADVTFVEAPESVEEIETVAREVPGPKVLNYVQGGKTPEMPLERLQELGYSIALYANLPLVVGMHAVRNLLEVMHRQGGVADSPPFVNWTERQAVVRKDFYDALGERYSTAPPITQNGAAPRDGVPVTP